MKTAASSLLFIPLLLVEQCSAAKVFALDISRSTSSAAQLRRRNTNKAGSFTEVVQNGGAGNGYTANITVGTPPQTLSLGIDTGSTDVWVTSSNASLCIDESLQNQIGHGCVGGTFDASKSSTVAIVDGNFSIQYQDKSGGSGEYITDVLSIGDSTITGMQMGLVFNTSSASGTLGLGFDSHEASNKTYPSLIDQLVSQSYINTKAYSIYLNDLASSTGSILFGGIDTEKFIGDLTALPIIPDPELATPSSPGGTVISFEVILSTISVTGQAGNTTTFPLSSIATDGSTVPAIGALLDTGTTLTYLPTNAIQGIYSILGAVVSTQNLNNVWVNCDLLTSAKNLTINYQFANSTGPTIKVPISELIYELSAYGPIGSHASSFTDLPFTNTCIFGILDASNVAGATILGDTFLRSAYVVYDLDNAVVGIAQTNFNSTGSNIVEIGASSSGLPTASGVAGSATATGTSTSATATTTVGTSAGGSSSTGHATTTGSGAASSTTSKAAAVASTPPLEVGGLFVIVISGVFSIMGAGWFLI